MAEQTSTSPVVPGHRGETQREVREDAPDSVLHYISVLLRRRWLIIFGTLVVASAAAFYTKRLPPVFTASAKFLPSQKSDMSARMGSIVGGGIPADDFTETTTADYFTALLQSPLFLERIILKRFFIQRLGGEVELLKYFESEGDTQPKETRLQSGIEALAKMISVEATKQTVGRRELPIITISANTTEARLSADLVAAVLDELVVYNQRARNAKAIQNREFIEKQLQDTKALLDEAEADLALFTSRNRVIVTADLETQQQRLTRNRTMQEEIYITLKKQLELAKIQEQENRVSIEIIQRPAPPLRKSGPKNLQNVLVAGFAGIVVFCSLALVLDSFKNRHSDDKSLGELRAAMREIAGDFSKIGRVFGIRKRKNRTI